MTIGIFIAHFWEFFFAPHGEAWYRGAVWGNVVAVIPLAVLGTSGLLYHHLVLKRLHNEHSRHLKAIVDLLDPETDGGLKVVLDRLDPDTDGGLKVVLAAIEDVRGDIVNTRSSAEPARELPSDG